MGSAPTPGTRVEPSYHKMKDGYKTIIAFAANSGVNFWEMDTKPPGIDGGEAINTTTMHNAVWETMAARSLKKLTEGTSKVNYNPKVYDEIKNLVNVETTVTILFPNGGSYAFYGYLQKFEPADLKSGEFPEATITIQPTNADPSDGSEQAPVYTAPVGSA